MASFESINYSLRPSKNIQRQIIFDGIRTLKLKLGLTNMVYIGFGSVWFTDFMMAHKLLDIEDMASMENDEIGYFRACFNKPYKTVDVFCGPSYETLAELQNHEKFHERSWVVWLDYDVALNEAIKDDIRFVIEKSPENTIFLATFDGRERKYGKAEDRVERLSNLLGKVVPSDLLKKDCTDTRMQETLANLMEDFMHSVAVESRRPGGFKSAFRVIYKDTSPMVTIGGILPAPGKSEIACEVIDTKSWKCRPEERIIAPHLTIREVAALQSMLPNPENLSRATIRDKGFDLKDEQIESFQKYYREYPVFVQIIA